MKYFLTPQEKKQLSYEKDRRNTYGESRAASRKSIAIRKTKARRALRHAQDLAVATFTTALDEADPVVRQTGKMSWRKFPDAPLADYVGRTLNRRAAHGMNPSLGTSSLLRKARRRLVPRPVLFKGPLQNDTDKH